LSSTTALSRRIHSGRNGRVLLYLAVVPVLGLVLAFSACGSSSSNSSDAPNSSPTTSSQASNTKAECSSQAILSALPGGATMQEFTCAKVGDAEWAAARVSPGDTVFFLQWNGTKWNAEDSQSICGTASAGLPQSLLSYCKAAPSSSPTSTSPTTPATAACTSEAILAALPAGATMKNFTCADVSGNLWAAARVNPGDTVFFLQWNGTKWNAQDSDSVCGTASAGLPQSLLSYCKAAPSSSSTTPATAACTSEAILAALPAGATMQEFTCADVGGKLWAAARVDPGETVFFLQWNGSKWNAQDSNSVCGTASAGLPQSLLSYCK
jgi:co-chaperonin GroES (HSP10)